MFKHIIAVALFPMLLCSCGSTYYYAQVDSTDPYIQKGDRNKFITKSDSIDIAYSFKGENAPLSIEVFNKMKRNLYIDWDQSYFIFGDDAESQTNLGQFVEADQSLQEVAPFDEIEKRLFELSNLRFDKIHWKKFKSEAVEISDNTMTSLDVAHFNEENTPLYMRGFLAFHIGSKHTRPIIYQQDFYVKKLIKTNEISPSNMMMTRRSWADYFYTRKENGKGLKNVLTTSGAILVTAALVAGSIAYPDDTEE